MDDLLSEFLTETAESLEVIDNELVRFEADPRDAATLNNIFRLVHTIKGTCGFLGLPRLEAVAHAGETLLGRFRDGVLRVTPDAVTVVLESIDRIKELLAALERDGVEPPGSDVALIAKLEAASEGAAAPPADHRPPPPFAGAKWDEAQGRYLRLGEVSLADLEAAFRAAEGPVDPASEAESSAPAPDAHQLQSRLAAAFEAEDLDADARDGALGARDSGIASQSVRVNVDVLEQLMTMVSELVLTRNQLLQMVRNVDNSEFKGPLQRLSNITAELQDRVMKTRMQPIGNAWKKLPRIVRDAARELGKKIELRMEGEGAELDRQVLELIKDPLTHMIRNSCDHGVETPDVRAASGKSETGTIRLKAFHEGGHILIEVSDDGAGLNTARIREKIVGKGLAPASEVAGMSEAQIQRYIFAPGFSTAAKVTNLSGRGVGMDVVRTNVEQIGGSIDLQSVEGRGTTFTIKIPLTLAIVSAMIVGVGGARFALPQISVLELVRASGAGQGAVESINKSRVLRLRDRLLPLVSLREILQIDGGEGRENADRYVVVMQAGGQVFGALVDDVLDTEEIVVKPLASVLRGMPQFSGATILGDGSVIMIVDPNGIAAHVGESAREETAQAGQSGEQGDSAVSLLLFEAGGAEPKAAPLSLVTRLEEVDVAALERADGRVMMQYRGALMPVVHAAGDYAFRTEGRQPILVFSRDGRSMGLAVDRIVDIAYEVLNVDLASHRPGVIGAAVIKGKATEVVDIGHFLMQAHEDWFRAEGISSPRKILLVEPDAFARNLLAPLLSAAGYNVSTVENADAALRSSLILERFDAILADLDSNPQAAANFARKLQDLAPQNGAALLGLSGGEARVAGYSDVVSKSDRSGLLAALAYALKTRGEAA